MKKIVEFIFAIPMFQQYFFNKVQRKRYDIYDIIYVD